MLWFDRTAGGCSTDPENPVPVHTTPNARPLRATNHSSITYIAGKYKNSPPTANKTPCVASSAAVELQYEAAMSETTVTTSPITLEARRSRGYRCTKSATPGDERNIIAVAVVEMAAMPPGCEAKGSWWV